MTDETLVDLAVDRKVTMLNLAALLYAVNGSPPTLDAVIEVEDFLAQLGTIIGATYWVTVPGTPVRTSNTTFTVTGDYSSTTIYSFGKCTVFRWAESGVIKCAMQSIPQTYGAPNTTFTIIGDVMASIDVGSLKYSSVGTERFILKFAKAGSISAIETNVMNQQTALFPMRVFGTDLHVGTPGTTNNTTVDINKNGVTMFTTKPTLATTVQYSPTPFTADSGVSLAIGDKVTIDQDAFQATPATDEYVDLYVFPTRYLSLA